MMPASAVQTRTWFRPDGWFSAREEAIVVNRVLQDDPSKGDMHNRQSLTLGRLWEALKDYDCMRHLGAFLLLPSQLAPIRSTRRLGQTPFARGSCVGPANGGLGAWSILELTRLNIVWPLYAIGLVAFIPQQPPKVYITLILRSLGFGTFTTNLLTIPAVSHTMYDLSFLPH